MATSTMFGNNNNNNGNNKKIDLIDLSIDDDEDDSLKIINEKNDIYNKPTTSYLSKLPINILTPQSSLNLNELTQINASNNELKLIKKDKYCWICHIDLDVINCNQCLRSYHEKCLIATPIIVSQASWTCEECECLKAAREEKRVISKVKPEQFILMLENAIKRLKYPGSEPFQSPVDLNQFQDYRNFVIFPMDLSLMENKIKAFKYESLEEFLSDIKWMVHNSSVYNGVQSKVTATAKSILRMVKHEINEMEVCPDCYLNSILKFDDNWFCEPCRIPHPLIWAKMKGFPYWPAKALRVVNGDIDVRFFGAHDRSWVSTKKCFWLSKNVPSSPRQRINNLQPSLIELELHIERLIKQYGEFEYAPNRLAIDPEKPFIFLPKLKDQSCLQVIIDSSKNARKMYIQRSNSDAESLCSSKINDNLIDNDNDSKLKKKKKRKIKSSKNNQSLEIKEIDKNKFNKSKRLCTNRNIDNKKNNNISNTSSISSSSLSSPSSSINSDAMTKKNKAIITISNNDGESSFSSSTSSDESDAAMSENSFTGNDNNKNKNKNKTSNNNNNKKKDEDPFEPPCLDMSSKENSYILKTLFLEKPKCSNIENETKTCLPTTTSSTDDVGNDFLEKLVNDCKRALGIENVELVKENKLINKLSEIKIEKTFNTDDLLKQKIDENDDFKLKFDENKKIFEDNKNKEIELIKQNYEKLLKESQYNSELKIKEILAECTKEKLKLQKKYEKIIEDTKRKQWCSNCYKEAIYYCCWNTSYCDENCQREHWSTHMNTCLGGKDILDSNISTSKI